jgi:CheY-like chemotaxis protein
VSEAARILVVEDDAAIATGLGLNLKLEGYVAEVVGDGVLALAPVRAGRKRGQQRRRTTASRRLEIVRKHRAVVCIRQAHR